MDIIKHVTRAREKIIKELLPDRCKIRPKVGDNPIITGAGILTYDQPDFRVWRLDENDDPIIDVPCRIDLSRAFRPDKLKAQATEVDEFNLELPFDMHVEPTDYIFIVNPTTAKLERFEIRKMKNLSEFDGTIECTIATLGVVDDGEA